MSDALWPGDYPAGRYLSLLVLVVPLLLAMGFCVYMAIRSGAHERRTHVAKRSAGGSVSTGLVGLPKVVYERSTDPRCSHRAAEEIVTVDGIHVGYLCPDCDEALPIDMGPGAWRRNFFINSAANAASVLMSAGFDPQDALLVTGLSEVPNA